MFLCCCALVLISLPLCCLSVLETAGRWEADYKQQRRVTRGSALTFKWTRFASQTPREPQAHLIAADHIHMQIQTLKQSEVNGGQALFRGCRNLTEITKSDEANKPKEGDLEIEPLLREISSVLFLPIFAALAAFHLARASRRGTAPGFGYQICLQKCVSGSKERFSPLPLTQTQSGAEKHL